MSQAGESSVEPKQENPQDRPSNELSVDAVPPAWLAAAESVRTAVRWMVTAFAAIGATLFAQGFVSSPDLSWKEDTWQLISAWTVGAAGLLALGWLIYLATALLRPTLYELGTLPEDYKKLLNAEPLFYLPSDVRTYEDFLVRFEALQAQEMVWRAKVSRAELALTAAASRKPVDREEVNAASLEVVRATRTHDSLVGLLGVYNATRKDILDRAGFWKVSHALDASDVWIATAAVLAAVGGVGYTLLLAAPGESEKESEDGTSAAAPRIATMIKTSTTAGDDLWKMLRLADCQEDPSDQASSEVQVVVSSGAGVPSDPYTVTTLPTPTCRSITFTVINEIAMVSEPVKMAITYTPAPSPSDTALPSKAPNPFSRPLD